MKLNNILEDTVAGNIAVMPGRLALGSVRRRMLPQGYKYIDSKGKIIDYDEDGNAVELNEAGFRRKITQEEALQILQSNGVESSLLPPVDGVTVNLKSGSYIYTQINPLTQEIDYFLVLDSNLSNDVDNRHKDVTQKQYGAEKKVLNVKESAGSIKRISFKDATVIMKHHNMDPNQLLSGSGYGVITLPCGSIITIEVDRINAGQSTYYLKIAGNPDWLHNINIDLGGKEGPSHEKINWNGISETLNKKMAARYPNAYFRQVKESVGIGDKRIGKENIKFYNDRGKLVCDCGRRNVIGDMPKTNEGVIKAVVHYIMESHIL